MNAVAQVAAGMAAGIHLRVFVWETLLFRRPGVGRALVLYTCGFMVPAGIGLAVSDRLALSRPKGAGVVGAIAQLTPPARATRLPSSSSTSRGQPGDRLGPRVG
ncbi:hypothetical protein [Saccharothrix sp. 6-C]|uniref:hypothetical protein n=1 Tax=Saccharothrix sp. 6-C TaxID=2781735 RepID=UPI001F3F442D|nr:hypothetical protein [Saccharothrix sp. 6-C]